MKLASVLLSGGIDSTTCLYLAAHRPGFVGDIIGFSVDYGQRHSVEIAHARRSCSRLGIEHRMIDLSAVVPSTMLTDKDSAIPNVSYGDIVGVSPTYVPFRNGLMLAALACCFHGSVVGETPDCDRGEVEHEMYFGAHADDAQAWAYPDCTPEFIGAMANAIYIGTYRQVRLITPLQWMVKHDIVRLGDRLGVAWEDTWSCYKGGEVHCGVCPTCRARRKGFTEARVSDPTVYAETPDDL